MRIFPFISVCSLSLLAFSQGCVNTKDIAKTGKSLEVTASKLAQGMDQFDIGGIKELVRTNTALREQLFALKTRLESLPAGDTVVVLQNRKIQFQIAHYTGSLRIQGSIDSQTNWFWTKRLHDTNVVLNINYRNVLVDGLDDNARRAGIHPLHRPRNANLGNLMVNAELTTKIYEKAVNNTFNEFLQSSPLIPAPDERHMDLQSSFLTPGDHTVLISIIPLASDRNKRWSLRGRIVSIAPDGYVEKIKEFDVDSDLYPNQKLGIEIPQVRAFLRIK